MKTSECHLLPHHYFHLGFRAQQFHLLLQTNFLRSYHRVLRLYLVPHPLSRSTPAVSSAHSSINASIVILKGRSVQFLKQSVIVDTLTKSHDNFIQFTTSNTVTHLVRCSDSSILAVSAERIQWWWKSLNDRIIAWAFRGSVSCTILLHIILVWHQDWTILTSHTLILKWASKMILLNFLWFVQSKNDKIFWKSPNLLHVMHNIFKISVAQLRNNSSRSPVFVDCKQNCFFSDFLQT